MGGRERTEGRRREMEERNSACLVKLSPLLYLSTHVFLALSQFYCHQVSTNLEHVHAPEVCVSREYLGAIGRMEVSKFSVCTSTSSGKN